MDEETDFAALYKRLIADHFAPEPGRAEAALRGILGRLATQDTAKVPLENKS